MILSTLAASSGRSRPSLALSGASAPSGSLSSGVATGAVRRSLRLLNRLHTISRTNLALPTVPVVPHQLRLASARRGLSRAALQALRQWCSAHELDERTLSEVCFGEGTGSLCALTRHTGLSLVETLVLLADETEPQLFPVGPLSRSGLALSAGSGVRVASSATHGAAGIVGDVTTLISCDPSTTRLSTLLASLDSLLSALDAAEDAQMGDALVPQTRYLWLEALAVSPNLVAGHFSPDRSHAAPYAAPVLHTAPHVHPAQGSDSTPCGPALITLVNTASSCRETLTPHPAVPQVRSRVGRVLRARRGRGGGTRKRAPVRARAFCLRERQVVPGRHVSGRRGTLARANAADGVRMTQRSTEFARLMACALRQLGR